MDKHEAFEQYITSIKERGNKPSEVEKEKMFIIWSYAWDRSLKNHPTCPVCGFKAFGVKACVTCKGTGSQMIGNVCMGECATCNGTGKQA